MDEYIAVYRSHIKASRREMLFYFYKRMTSQQRFEVMSGVMVTVLVVMAALTIETNNLVVIFVMFLASLLSIYMTVYIIQKNFRRAYLPLYTKFGDKIEFFKDEYIYYLLFIRNIRVQNHYMIDTMNTVISAIKTELDFKSLPYPLFSTLPKTMFSLLLTILIGSLMFKIHESQAAGDLSGLIIIAALLVFALIMSLIFVLRGVYSRYRKSLCLNTLKKHCRWVIRDIKNETNFDVVEDIFD